MTALVAVDSGVRQLLAPAHSIIGQARFDLPIGGRIRAGIKVLTRAAQQNQKAVSLYEAGLNRGESFDKIGREIAEAVPSLSNPLIPRNVPYFTVRKGDFVDPANAARILGLYGEEREDGERRLYRFPIIFAVDQWAACIPHALRAFGASGLKYWSEFTPEGRRMCRTFAPVQVDAKAKRKPPRIFGGRPVINRDDRGGECQPEACPEYQGRTCTMTGHFRFYIPGIPGAGLIEIPTNSFYAMANARKTLEMIAHLRGGRISGLNDGAPLFYLTKKEHEIAMIDPETGQPKRTHHWLVEIEANVDMSKLFVAVEEHHLLTNGSRAAAVLGAAVPRAEDAGSPQLDEVIEGTATQIDADSPKGEDVPPSADLEATKLKAARKRVQALAERAQILPDSLSTWATLRFQSPQWSRQLDSLAEVEHILEACADLRAALVYRVSALEASWASFDTAMRASVGLEWDLDPMRLRKVSDLVDAAMQMPNPKAYLGIEDGTGST